MIVWVPTRPIMFGELAAVAIKTTSPLKGTDYVASKRPSPVNLTKPVGAPHDCPSQSRASSTCTRNVTLRSSIEGFVSEVIVSPGYQTPVAIAIGSGALSNATTKTTLIRNNLTIAESPRNT